MIYDLLIFFWLTDYLTSSVTDRFAWLVHLWLPKPCNNKCIMTESDSQPSPIDICVGAFGTAFLPKSAWHLKKNKKWKLTQQSHQDCLQLKKTETTTIQIITSSSMAESYMAGIYLVVPRRFNHWSSTIATNRFARPSKLERTAKEGDLD